ncbi:unnamed protein product [Spirodela intermedia]|uniref:Uncharacterized protein n=1 Tax=Spirodela intermedia TaxID=51605 RepID=A0A7I8IDN6_SPIIN|nr:unnamed protein product [Spirodela intermedia]CAA6655731.1 unnamed protein product [Spirodela intermedia]
MDSPPPPPPHLRLPRLPPRRRTASRWTPPGSRSRTGGASARTTRRCVGSFSHVMNVDFVKWGSFEKNCESMDATWESIAHGRRLSKNNTWGPPARVPLERSRDAAVGARLMKSETFQETSSSSAGARSARPSPLSPKTQGRVVAVPEDLDEMDRRCEAFINKVRARMNLERQESFRRRCQDISARLNDSLLSSSSSPRLCQLQACLL